MWVAGERGPELEDACSRSMAMLAHNKSVGDVRDFGLVQVVLCTERARSLLVSGDETRPKPFVLSLHPSQAAEVHLA